MFGRLESLRVPDYKVRLNEETGNVTVELDDDLNADTRIQYLICNGDFSITDSEDGTVLLDKSDVKEARVLYSRGSATGVSVYLNIVLNKEGKEKLTNISREYLKPEEKETNSEDQADANVTGEETTATEEGASSESPKKQVTLTLEGNEMMTTSFAEVMTNGELPISLGTSMDNDTLQEYVEQAEFYAMLINNPDMPLTYEIDTSSTIKGNLDGNDVYMIIGIVAAICAIIIIYMICRFKLDGVIVALTNIAAIGLLLLAIRYTNTEVSLNSAAAIITIMVLNAYLISKMLSKIKAEPIYGNVRKVTIKTYLENLEIIVVSLIVAIVFTFMQKAMAFSFGMTLFYGIISVAIANLVFLRPMLMAKYSEK